MSKARKITTFNPSESAQFGSVFGLPFTCEEAEVVILPLPWEVTVSYGTGTIHAPEAILKASLQVDLLDPHVKDAWKLGIAMAEIDVRWKKQSLSLREKAGKYRALMSGAESGETSRETARIREEVESVSQQFNQWVKEQTSHYLNNNKLVVGLGGDHSSPLGIIQALGEKYSSFGILQLDAHADLRNAYEGFVFSHASIMFNALKIPAVSKLTQVGIRDYCDEEANVIDNSNGRIATFFDKKIRNQIFRGRHLSQIYQEVVKTLPETVYISFDIDGLNPHLCPNTGTPVPGGLDFEEALFLIEVLIESGRVIIGFDLNEVSPGENEWDANVASRLLYRICNMMGRSQKRI